ncbi:MAG: hypothetical protein ACFFC7_06990 [Candidatus Hermodarchaeota archaeon]
MGEINWLNSSVHLDHFLDHTALPEVEENYILDDVCDRQENYGGNSDTFICKFVADLKVSETTSIEAISSKITITASIFSTASIPGFELFIFVYEGTVIGLIIILKRKRSKSCW